MTVSTSGIGLERAKVINNNSHPVLAGQSLVRNTFVCFDATTTDEVREGANTVGLRLAGISDGVYSAGEQAGLVYPDYITVTDASAALKPGDRAYIATATTVTNSGNVAVGTVLFTEVDGVADRVLVRLDPHAPAGGTRQVYALVNTVLYTNTTNKTLGIIPANADIIDIFRTVTTAFNDSGTDVLNVGTTSGDPDEFIDGDDVTNTGLTRAGSGATMPATGLGDVGATPITVLGKYTGQNSNASTGAATVTILYTLA